MPLAPEYHFTDLSNLGSTIPQDKPIVMLNLLRFNAQASYPADSSYTSCSGQEAYLSRYVGAFHKVTTSLGVSATPIYVGVVHAGLLAGKDVNEKWDMMAMVKYDSFGHLRRILENEEYVRDAQIHHHAGVEAWRFHVTTEAGT